MASFAPVVRVGVGAILSSEKHPNCILIGRRKGSHGAGRLSLPGGHLELGEAWATCAEREVKEETNLDVTAVGLNHVTNDVAIDGNPEKHYITIFMNAVVNESSAELQNMEPHKCDGWEWVDIDDLLQVHRENPQQLFDPLARFISEDKRFLPSRD